MALTIIQKKLFELQDLVYADFQSKLVPALARELFIGVRVPELRRLAKQLRMQESQAFLQRLPHHYYDENLFHAILLSELKDFDECLQAVENFLPYIDNWAVCDILSPKIFKTNKTVLLQKIRLWATSKHNYTRRFAITMLMSHFLDEDFKVEYLEIPASIRSEEYYVNMAIAWFYATALAKQWPATIVYLEDNRLPTWVHLKTIQKGRESYRINADQKQYLATLRRKT
ncbi:MAG: DNA alkylation repair protein [Alcaligenaceae bacterium]|nr:DNA alkylation repair protein [Alcaligenaceae bacterium]